MVKGFIKKIIVFIIPFLFVLNIYAAEGKLLTYKYKVAWKDKGSKDYIINVSLENDIVNKITITEYSSDQTGVGNPEEILNLTYYLARAGLVTDKSYLLYGITSYNQSLDLAIDEYSNANDYYEKTF